MKKIIITGGSGFIGTQLTRVLLDRGYSVTVFDRVAPKIIHEQLTFVATDFSSDTGIVEPLQSADAIVHLAGASIFNRWTQKYKQEIIDSRINSARRMFEIIKQGTHRPGVFISASAVGYYGDRGDEALNESSPAGTDFLADVCVQWERAAHQFQELGIRTVSVRTAIVLGPGGGMMAKLLPIFRLGLGGRLGTGNQWFSWIHSDDLVQVYVHAIEQDISGPINAVAPGIVRNRDFTQILARVLRRPAWFMVPAWVLRIMLGEFSRAVLSSQRVTKTVITDQGFLFRYPQLEQSLSEIKNT